MTEQVHRICYHLYNDYTSVACSHCKKNWFQNLRQPLKLSNDLASFSTRTIIPIALFGSRWFIAVLIVNNFMFGNICSSNQTKKMFSFVAYFISWQIVSEIYHYSLVFDNTCPLYYMKYLWAVCLLLIMMIVIFDWRKWP